jgi:hypothetical protein
MSKGPGKLERAIADAFARQPSATFTVEDLGPICYPGLNQVEKKHRVAIIRAADKVAEHMWWGRTYSSGVPCVYRNLCDLHSYALGDEREEYMQSLKGNYGDVCTDAVFHVDDQNRIICTGINPVPRGPIYKSLAELEAQAEAAIRGNDNDPLFGGSHRRRVKLNTFERDGVTDTEEYRRLKAEEEAFIEALDRHYETLVSVLRQS